MKHRNVHCGYCKERGHTRRSCETWKGHQELRKGAPFPQKFSPGALVEITKAPGRYRDEHPRSWHGLEGTLATIISGPITDAVHAWGGRYKIVYLNGDCAGVCSDIYGDFVKRAC